MLIWREWKSRREIMGSEYGGTVCKRGETEEKKTAGGRNDGEEERWHSCYVSFQAHVTWQPIHEHAYTHRLRKTSSALGRGS